MRRNKRDLPIILSHNTQTGVAVCPNPKMGGKDLVIVGLNKEINTGESWEWEDVSWVKGVLHFGDVGSLRTTIDVLSEALKNWGAR